MNPLEDRSTEELEAASFMAGLFSTANSNDAASIDTARLSKRERDDSDSDVPPAKAKKSSSSKKHGLFPDAATTKKTKKPRKKKSQAPSTFAPPVLKAAPYFYYTDRSREVDKDPLALLTISGQVPNFPVKMHAILHNPELKHIIAWDTHGRSFKIIRPRQFEEHILPKYFEHSRMSSFLRQVNGWGFRRLIAGDNANSYYNEYFLRTMPWLTKFMTRPKVGEKVDIDEEHEPDLVAISAEFPLPDNPIPREIEVVLETIENGPKARMPFNWWMKEEKKKEKKTKVGSAKGPMRSMLAKNSGLLAPKEREDPAPSVAAAAASSNPPLPAADAQTNYMLSHQNNGTDINQEAILQALGYDTQYQLTNPSALSEPERKQNPEVQPPSHLANAPIAASNNPLPAADAENILILNYMAAQQNNGQDPMAAISNTNQAASLQAMGHDITDQGFLAGVAATSQFHNARMQSMMGGAMHPASVPNFASSAISQGNMGADPLMQAMLTLNQGNNSSNVLGIEDPTQEELDLQAALLHALQINVDLTNALLSFTQAAQAPNPVAMQRELQANKRLQAIQQHQGIQVNSGNNRNPMALEFQPAHNGTSPDGGHGNTLSNQQGSSNNNGLDLMNMTTDQILAILQANSGNL